MFQYSYLSNSCLFMRFYCSMTYLSKRASHLFYNFRFSLVLFTVLTTVNMKLIHAANSTSHKSISRSNGNPRFVIFNKGGQVRVSQGFVLLKSGGDSLIFFMSVFLFVLVRTLFVSFLKKNLYVLERTLFVLCSYSVGTIFAQF